ncbi:MAG: asparagine synthase (glutamine-hydrolyzing) [Gammaproteobacteria bacterium]|nr:asparagine synthase (glutamine-hydrolyzing) [Gammaproteobacteria bacterium]
MCGVAGIISTDVAADQLRHRVRAMQDRLQHRGPDDQGLLEIGEAGVCLAHTRLSIIDLSAAGHQPMQDASGRYSIVFNGEIYNYRELREQLSSEGVTFQSHSDTEVIIKLYQHEGPGCVNKLRGMFAFFIWDAQSNSGFAARDPLGIKPFYYCTQGNSFAFASELRALHASGLVSNSTSAPGVYGYLRSGSVPEPHTLLEQAHQLPAGHWAEWKNQRLQINSYHHIDFDKAEISMERAISITCNALIDSVKAHLVSDVPVGLFLSGGIDSTALLALASQYSDQPINTYSIAFEDPAWNEGDVARRVAEHFGANHTEWLLTAEIAQPLFEQFLGSADQPSIDGFNTFCVAKLAHDNGEKVVLSGLGGDELFGGYKSFQTVPRWHALGLRLAWLTPLFRFLSSRPRLLPNGRWRRALDFLAQPGNAYAAYRSLRSVFAESESTALMQSMQLVGNVDVPIEVSDASPDWVSKTELSDYMRNQLLRDSDVMSMAWGLELRVPLVDARLLGAVAKIPADIRLARGKQLLLDAVPEIPDWVAQRPKQGFRFPFDQWFADAWSTLPGVPNTPHWIELQPWYRRWSLVMLQHLRTQRS